MPSQEPPILAGCSSQDQQIFAARWVAVHTFLNKHLNITEEWRDLLMPEMQERLLKRFVQLEQDITAFSSDDTVARSRGRARWRDEFLLPLAESLNLRGKSLLTAIRRCQKRGYIQHRSRTGRRAQLESPERVRTRLDAVLDSSATTKQQAQALVATGICTTSADARMVLQALGDAEDRTAGLARGVVLAALRYGWVGVLEQSEYRWLAELFYVQEQVQTIAASCDNPNILLSHLRADVVALAEAINERKQAAVRWSQNLLHEPRNSLLRQRYQQLITASDREQIISMLCELRDCTGNEGTYIYDTCIARGFAGLLEWRAGSSLSLGQMTKRRIAQVAEQRLQGLAETTLKEIVHRIEQVHSATVDADVPLPFNRLLKSPPSSLERRRLSRRLSFGLSALINRRIHRQGSQQTKRKRRRGRTASRLHIVISEDAPQREARLVAAIVQQMNLSGETAVREVQDLLRRFHTYGGLGVLPKSDWARLIPDRLLSLLLLYKFGLIEGTIGQNQIMVRVREYAKQLGIEPPTSYLVHAIFNILTKAPHWNGGFGEAVATVRQRESLIVKAPRLNATWIVLEVRPRLRLQLLGEAFEPIGSECYVLIVIDMASERPVGCWLSPTPLDGDDVALAIYEAIWHPSTGDWPIRGVPSTLYVPKRLGQSRIDDLQRAAHWMTTEIEVIDAVRQSRMREPLAYADELLRRCGLEAPGYIRHKTGQNRLTCRDAHEALLSWLSVDEDGAARCFPNHRLGGDIPSDVRAANVVLPGYDCPGAGWLWPIVDEGSPTGRDVVYFQGIRFAAADFSCLPGLNVRVRAFPYRRPGATAGIFVENQAGALRFLTRLE